jgi:hypothetical protein
MKRIAATLALGVLIALLVGTGVASASHGTDSASGHVTDATGFTSFRVSPDTTVGGAAPPADVDFSAKASFNGTNARGQARFTFANEDPNQVFTGDVTCLTVVNGEAGLTGPITSARGGTTVTPQGQGDAFEPRSFRIVASDSGKFSNNPDTLAFVLFSDPPPQPCPIISFPSVVRDGEVVVHDG